MRVRTWLALALAVVGGAGASAQTAEPDSGARALPDVRVEATRGAGGVATAPFSVAVVERDRRDRASEAGASFTALTRRLPGVYAADRENPALGDRLIVRGLGYRSPFGVRGVQVVLDGIPLTLADGQAVLGVVDPGLVRQAEIVRGPASSLWGNGSGGVLFLRTVPTPGEPPTSGRVAVGSDGLVRASAEGIVRRPTQDLALAVSHTRGDGYRDHSAYAVTRARAVGSLAVGRTARLGLVGVVEDSPRLEHPGALTEAEWRASPRQAEARYVTTASGKASRQGQVGLSLDAPLAAGRLRATAYAIGRRLDNPLPFAYIQVDRVAGGTRLAFERDLGPVRVVLGSDAAFQRDDRTNRPNVGGAPGGPVTLDQVETVAQGALFARVRLDLGRLGLAGLAVEAALRGDRIRFEAADRRLDDGNQSGERALGAWSPQVGLTQRLGGALLFASLSTAFETPTTTELANRPDGAGGFNPTLRPQRVVGVEAGGRGLVGPVLVDVAAYALAVRDGLAPFEGDGGRTFFVNRGRTRHAGLEALAEWAPRPGVDLSLTYTLSRLRFGTASRDAGDETVAGNQLPGVPPHRLAARLRLDVGPGTLTAEGDFASAFFADDANTLRAPAAARVHLAWLHGGLAVGGVRVLPFMRVQNVLGAQTLGSVAINPRGGRFAEPAAGRTVQAGLTLER